MLMKLRKERQELAGLNRPPRPSDGATPTALAQGAVNGWPACSRVALGVQFAYCASPPCPRHTWAGVKPTSEVAEQSGVIVPTQYPSADAAMLVNGVFHPVPNTGWLMFDFPNNFVP